MASYLVDAVDGHELTTESINRPGGLISNVARCACGKPLSWYPREKQHAEHVLNVVKHRVWEECREALARAQSISEIPNPYPKD